MYVFVCGVNVNKWVLKEWLCFGFFLKEVKGICDVCVI